MPIVANPPLSSGQPQVVPPTCNWGGLPLPNGQGTFARISLNDSISWFLQAPPAITMARKLGISALAWRARGVYVSDDFGAKKIVLKELYSEVSPSPPLAAAKAQLTQVGEQYLSFDGQTQILAKLTDWGTPTSRRPFQPFLWDLNLTFTCREPWFKDISATTASYSFGNGTASTSVAYAGSVFAEPTYQITIPNSSTATITQLILSNTMSSETLTMTPLAPLAAGVAHTVTISSPNFTVLDENNTPLSFTGSFPMLYGPPTQSQTLATTVTPGTGVVSGVNLVTSLNNRWDM